MPVRPLVSTLAAVALATVLAGCQLRVATDIVVDDDGSGTIALRLVLDEELTATLEEAEFELEEGLAEVAAAAQDWELAALDEPAGVELRTSFERPEELRQRVEVLNAALSDDDGALLQDVELSLTEDGGYRFAATAGIDPPAVVGALPLGEDDAVTFDGEDLAIALRESGDEHARADLRVTFPTVPQAEGATVETTSATWQLPVHELATVSATAPPLPVGASTVVLVAAGVAAMLVGAFAVRVLRRR